MTWGNNLIKALEAPKTPDLLEQQFIIAGIDKTTGNMSVASKPWVHTSIDETMSEADRLAKANHNKKYVVLGVITIHTVADVEVTGRL